VFPHKVCVLQYVAVCCSVLQCVVKYCNCNAVQCIAVHCSVSRSCVCPQKRCVCVAVHCSVYCSVVYGSVLKCVEKVVWTCVCPPKSYVCCCVLRCCSVLWRVAVCCRALQCIVMQCSVL